MSDSLLLEVRRAEWSALVQSLRAWQDEISLERMRPGLAAELGSLAAELVGQQRQVVERIRRDLAEIPEDATTDYLDRLNEFWHILLEVAVASDNLLLALAAQLQTVGHTVEGVSELGDTLAEVRRLQDDLPDLLYLAYGPNRRKLREAADAMASGGLPESPDWREVVGD
jgi:hypothetical protein